MLFIRQNVLAILWSIIIIILCSIPGQEFPDTSFLDIPQLDKIIHFCLYFILSILTVKGFYTQDYISFLAKYSYAFAVVYSICLGIIIELLQHYFIPFRAGDVYDVFANVGGSITGTLFIYYKLIPRYFLLDN